MLRNHSASSFAEDRDAAAGIKSPKTSRCSLRAGQLTLSRCDIRSDLIDHLGWPAELGECWPDIGPSRGRIIAVAT
jgi:hypothetical protein